MIFQLVNKSLRLHNQKTRTAIDAKVLMIVICVESIIYLSLYSLLDCNLICQV